VSHAIIEEMKPNMALGSKKEFLLSALRRKRGSWTLEVLVRLLPKEGFINQELKGGN